MRRLFVFSKQEEISLILLFAIAVICRLQLTIAKRKRCGDGEYNYCHDKPKFGGKGVLKQYYVTEKVQED